MHFDQKLPENSQSLGQRQFYQTCRCWNRTEQQNPSTTESL